MNVVALISGGKDSCFNMMHCAVHGHRIVALANLKPPSASGKDELDSFMYQTVGHDAIQLYASCMDLPLYRREIHGTSVEQRADYRCTPGDETEDLYELLREVLKHHPEINAVSTGAILSNYQRVRVEHVCNRLGLTSLAYLWRRDQKELLGEMIASGVESVLVKVAAIGLGERHLGEGINAMYPYLCKMNDVYGLNICGEGGEYETFTLDCPLFKRRIRLEETEIVTHSDDAFAPVAYLRIKSAITEAKEKMDKDWKEKLRIPVWDDLENELIEEKELGNERVEIAKLNNSTKMRLLLDVEDSNPLIDCTHYSRPPFYAIGSTTAFSRGSETYETIEEETRICMENLQDKLSAFGLSFSDVVLMNVFVTNMGEFAQINGIYKQFFDINPPARACVAANLQPPAKIQIDCFAIKDTTQSERQTMHVQSLSYWAPANIGPYSQSVMIRNHAYIAGQIGMLPHTLALPSPPSSHTEALVALRHLTRITSVLSLSPDQIALCLCFVDDSKNFHMVRQVWREWVIKDGVQREMPVLLCVAVKTLPKNSKVEWQVFGQCEMSNGYAHEDNDEKGDAVDHQEAAHESRIQYQRHEEKGFLFKTSIYTRLPVFCAIVTLSTYEVPGLHLAIALFSALDAAVAKIPSGGWKNVTALRVFINEKVVDALDVKKVICKEMEKRGQLALTVVPVSAVEGGVLSVCIHASL
ncbi:uncharacterized protein VTP21DRAFT_5374 [Calcarisporiella thermophila]|uniref:uncharacterized protein n=1 Tax=Calcarisporiella thermophila TaxID=911321 RepID=UPI00374409E2